MYFLPVHEFCQDNFLNGTETSHKKVNTQVLQHQHGALDRYEIQQTHEFMMNLFLRFFSIKYFYLIQHQNNSFIKLETCSQSVQDEYVTSVSWRVPRTYITSDKFMGHLCRGS